MSCPDCEARRKMARDALLNAHIGKAAKHVAIGAAEAVGLKEKTGAAELQATKKKPARARKAQHPQEPQDQTLTPAPPENSPYGAGD